MTQEKNVSRRRFLKYAGGAAVAIAAVGGAAYYATMPSQVPTPTTTTSAATTSAAPVTTAAGAPIKMGATVELTGVYSVPSKGTLDGMRIAIDDWGGQVLGRPIQLLPRDTELSAEVATTRTRELIAGQGAEVICGSVAGPIQSAIAAVCEQNGILYLGNKCEYYYFWPQSKRPYNLVLTNYWLNNDAQRFFCEFVKEKLNKDTLFFIGADYLWGRDNGWVLKNIAPSYGLNLLGDVYWPFPTSDYRPFLTSAMEKNPGAICISGYGFESSGIAIQAHEMGIDKKIPIIHSCAEYGFFRPIPQEILMDQYFILMGYWNLDAKSAEYGARYKQKGLDMPSGISDCGYWWTTAWLDAVKKLGTTETAAVNAELRKGAHYTLVSNDERWYLSDGTAARPGYMATGKKLEFMQGPDDIFEIVHKKSAQKVEQDHKTMDPAKECWEATH